MKFNVEKNIDNNIVSATISVTSLGSNTLTEEQERNLITDFPRNVEFANISFSANMKMGADNLPIIADDSDVDSQLVEINELVNQIIPIDEDFTAKLSLNVKKVKTDELGDIFKTPESVCKAKVSLFYLKIKEEIIKLIEEMRTINDDFETDDEFSV